MPVYMYIYTAKTAAIIHGLVTKYIVSFFMEFYGNIEAAWDRLHEIGYYLTSLNFGCIIHLG